MAIRTILTAISGGSASHGAIETACRLARRFDAHVEAIHVRVDERQAVLLYGDGFGAPLAGELLEQIAQDAAKAAAAARGAFDAAIARHNLPLRVSPPAPAGPKQAFEASAAWREETGYAPDIVTRRGRLFDLIVLGRSDRVVDEPHSDAVEDAVLQSGRPVLLAPAHPPDELGRAIAVGWNGSPSAVHAISAALPFLLQAKDVRIITVGPTEDATAVEPVEYLAWHGIAATARDVKPVDGVGPGEQLLATARDEGCDFLVMGGYGHTPWRELIFGGATRQIVGTAMLPLLLAH